MKSCSIIIRCCNEEKYIGRLLQQITQQTIRGMEIIVVDSGSVDRTLEIVSDYTKNIIRINSEEFSFGRSLNLGCGAATKEIIVIASAHISPVSDKWLEKLLTLFNDPKVALVYGKQRGDGDTQYSEHMIFEELFSNYSNPNQDYPFCNNANAAIRRSVWEQLPYDESLPGLEDLDWAVRAMKRGNKIVYCAEAEIVHSHDEAASQVFNRYRREAIAAKRIFPNRRFTLLRFLKLLITKVIKDGYHARQGGVLLKNIISISIFRLMQFWGTYSGFRHRGVVDMRLRSKFYYQKKSN